MNEGQTRFLHHSGHIPGAQCCALSPGCEGGDRRSQAAGTLRLRPYWSAEPTGAVESSGGGGDAMKAAGEDKRGTCPRGDSWEAEPGGEQAAGMRVL